MTFLLVLFTYPVPNHCNGALVASLLHLTVPGTDSYPYPFLSGVGPTLVQCLRSPYPKNDASFLIRNKQTSELTVLPVNPYLAYYNMTPHLGDSVSTLSEDTLNKLASNPPSLSQVIELVSPQYGYPEHACLHRYV